MSIKYASTSNITTKDIPSTPVATSPSYIVPDWVRPSDWLALPSITASQHKFVGLHAVTDDDSNFVGMTFTMVGTNISGASVLISNGTAGVSGTILTPRDYSTALQYGTGMYLTGGVLTGTVRVSETKFAGFAGSIAAGTSTLTVSNINVGSSLIHLGMAIVADNSTMYYVTAFGTGTGGDGTYTLNATVPGGTTASVGVSYVISAPFNATTTVTATNSYTVDWGDGIVEEYLSGVQANHQYTYANVPGIVSTRGYKMAIVTVTGPTAASGAVMGFIICNLQVRYNATTPGTLQFYRGKWLDIALSSNQITSFLSTSQTAGPTATITMSMLEQIRFLSCSGTYINFTALFANGTALQSVPTMPATMNNVTNISNMFTNCPALVKVPALGNTIKVTTTGSMFTSCVNLLDTSNLSNQNFSNVTNMFDMFNGCNALKEVAWFDTSKVLSFGRTFANCASLITVPVYNTANVTDMRLLFQGSASLESVPAFNTSNAQNMAGIFQGCVSLKTAPQLDYSKATAIDGLFATCTTLKSVPPLNIPLASNAAGLFQNCTSLVTIPLLNMPNVTVTSGMFQGCSSLDTLPPIVMTKVTTATSMFAGCRSLISIDISDTGNLSNINSMFSTCINLQQGPNLVTDKVTNMGGLFTGCSSLISIPTYNTINVTSMNGTFQTCPSLDVVPLLNTSNVTDMTNMFNGCFNLESLPAFDTSKVTLMLNSFTNMTKLLKFEGFNTSNVTNFTGTFNGCATLTKVSNLNMNSDTVTATTNIFASCPSLSSVGVSNARVSVSFATCSLSKNAIETIFDGLAPVATSRDVVVSSNWGADTAISRTLCTTTTNQTTVTNTGIQAAGVTVGSYVTGTGVTAALTVTANSGNNRISSSVITIPSSTIGSRVSFTTTANGLTAYAIYYVIAVESGQIRISTTPGGTEVDITGDGTMTMNIENQVVAVNTNDVSLAWPASASGSQTLAFRKLNTNIARLKNWAVTG